MRQIRLGIVGMGVQGSYHARYLMKGEVEEIRLCAVCDTDPAKRKAAEILTEGKAAVFEDAEVMFQSGTVHAALISTPHFMHPALAEKALKAGLHVMVEKPAGVYARQVRELNKAAEKSGKVFGVMFNQRTNPLYAKMKEMIEGGELGELRRTNWIITDWYRPQCYYDSGGWRATWAGEGGGVLLNQNPHNLDLWQWICGMPAKLFAICDNGKYHNIEVEDDVTVLARYANGATGVYITTTGETPGTNRLEVTGDKGKLVIEGGVLKFWKLDMAESEFTKQCTENFGAPGCKVCEVKGTGTETKHQGILRNWAHAILDGTELLAPGKEGIYGVEISNAIHLSAWTGRWIELPADEEKFLKELNARIEHSCYKRGKEYEGC